MSKKRCAVESTKENEPHDSCYQLLCLNVDIRLKDLSSPLHMENKEVAERDLANFFVLFFI